MSNFWARFSMFSWTKIIFHFFLHCSIRTKKLLNTKKKLKRFWKKNFVIFYRLPADLNPVGKGNKTLWRHLFFLICGSNLGSSVSNGTGQYNFSGQRDRSSIIVSGQRDKLKILPRNGTGRDSQNPGRDKPGQPKSRTGRGTKQGRAEKDVLKQEKDILKQKRMF